MNKPFQRAGGYRFGFYHFIHMKKAGVIKLFIHVHLK